MLKKIVPEDDYQLSKVQDHVAEAIGTIEGMPWNSGVLFEDVVFTGTSAALVSDWTTYTPTGTFVTNTTYSGKYRRVGQSLEMDVHLAFTGAPTSTSLDITMPTNPDTGSAFVIDPTRMGAASPNPSTHLGIGLAVDTGTNEHMLRMLYNTTTVSRAVLFVTSGASATETSVTQANPFTIANTDQMWFHYSAPVTAFTSGNGADKIIDHGLRRVPRGFVVLKKNAPGDIYESSTSNPRPDLQIILKATSAMTASIWVF